jgi:hypothetical protein
MNGSSTQWLRTVGALAVTCLCTAALTLQACSNGGGGTNAPTGMTAAAVKSTTQATSPSLAIQTSSYRLVSSTRVGRTTYDYTYTVVVVNSSTIPAANVTATVTSTAAATVVEQGTVAFGNVAANGQATSIGTFTIQQDRTVAFNPAALTWQVQGTTNTNMPGGGALGGFATQTYPSVVKLPVGSALVPQQLTVLTSVAQQIPAPSGQFSIQGYSFPNSSQVVTVLSPNGHVMLLGWLDANHASVSASTTAEVMAYFALGGHLLLNTPDTASLIQDIPNAPGFATLAQAIATAIAANPDTFGAANPTVQAALNAFVSPLLPTPTSTQPASAAATPRVRAARRASTALTAAAIRSLVATELGGATRGNAARPLAVTVGTGLQSGILVNTYSPFSFDVTNNTRRRAYAYVNKVQTITNGQTQTDNPPVLVGQFDVDPEGGVSGGAVGALGDVVTAVTTAYFASPGTSLSGAVKDAGTAYTPVNSPGTGPIALTLDPGSSETDYNVTVVGCGGGNPSAIAGLTSDQNTQRITVCLTSFVTDILTPLLANYLFGSGEFPQLSEASGVLGTFGAALADNLVVDLLNYYQNLQTQPNIVSAILSGDFSDAIDLFFTAGFQSNSFLNGGLNDALQLALTKVGNTFPQYTATIAQASTAAQNTTKAFSNALNYVSFALQALDTTVMLNDIRNADGADVFPLKVTPETVKVNPVGQIGFWGGEQIQFTASLIDTTSTEGYTFLWKTTGNAGNLLVNGTPVSPTSYCSNSAVAQYVTSATAPPGVSALDDTIFVTPFYGPGSTTCSASAQAGPAAQTTLTVKENSAIVISPKPFTTTTGTQTTFVATQMPVQNSGVVTAGDIDIPTPPPAASWVWTLTGNGSIGGSPITTKVPQIGYTAGNAGTDTLTVVAYDANNNALGTDTSTITVNSGGGLTFTASGGSACCGGVQPGTYSTATPGEGFYGVFIDNNNNLVNGLVVLWNLTVNYSGNSYNPNPIPPSGPWQVQLNLALPIGGTITGPGTWTSRAGILDAVAPGNFIFMSPSADNQGKVVITSVERQDDGSLLATFTFTESSTSPSSTRTYQGNGQFTIPPPQ